MSNNMMCYAIFDTKKGHLAIGPQAIMYVVGGHHKVKLPLDGGSEKQVTLLTTGNGFRVCSLLVFAVRIVSLK
jgi:hypothetical protein